MVRTVLNRKKGKIMRRFIAILVVVGFCFAGCASFGVWNDKAAADIAKFQTYAAQFLAGVKQTAPALLAVASAIPQAAPYVPAASAAITALEAATAAASEVGAASTSQSAQAVTAAQVSVSQAIGAVQATIATVKATGQATSPVPTPATPTGSSK